MGDEILSLYHHNYNMDYLKNIVFQDGVCNQLFLNDFKYLDQYLLDLK